MVFVIEGHSNKGIKAFKCDICNKDFSEARNLRDHHTIFHEWDQNLECDLCDFVLDEESTYTHFNNVHEGVKPYKCNVCYEAFIDVETIKLHLDAVHKVGKAI